MKCILSLATSLLICLFCVGSVLSQTPPVSQEQLIAQQRLLADRFSKLEELFLRMSEFESATNPSRAGLLQQAAKLSKEQAMVQRMASASELLTKKQFSRAIEEQQVATESLQRLLELLQSENRQDRLRDKRQQVEEWIRNIQKLQRVQQSLRGRTENGQDAKEASQDQAALEKQVQELLHAMEADSEKKGEPQPPVKPAEKDPTGQDSQAGEPKQGEPKQGEPKQGEQGEPKQEQGEPKQGEPKQGEPKQGEPKQGEPKQGEPKQGEPKQGEPKQGEPKQGEPKQGEPKQGDEQQPSEPSEEPKPQDPQQQSRQSLEKARRRMEKAVEELEKQKNSSAVQEQKQAEDELKKAVTELERILRQLREEEVERSLVALEARFRRMLEMQLAVVNETTRLATLTGDARDRQLEIQANKLALEERKILLDGQRAMMLLEEEGSSTAFPEAVQQMLADIQMVVERLQKSDVGKLTVSIEEEIVAALEELIEALVAEIKKKEDEKKQKQEGSGQPSEGQQQDQALVDALAELRLIKTLQLRINKRTGSLSDMLRDRNDPIGQAQDTELRSQLLELAKRQQKVQEVTRDIVIRSQKDQQ